MYIISKKRKLIINMINFDKLAISLIFIISVFTTSEENRKYALIVENNVNIDHIYLIKPTVQYKTS